MKRYRAVVLYGDKTYEAKGFDVKEEAQKWCAQANKRSTAIVFWSFVTDGTRNELVYTDLE